MRSVPPFRGTTRPDNPVGVGYPVGQIDRATDRVLAPKRLAKDRVLLALDDLLVRLNFVGVE